MVGNISIRTRASQETGRHDGLPRKPFIGGWAAIAEGYQDHLDKKEDGMAGAVIRENKVGTNNKPKASQTEEQKPTASIEKIEAEKTPDFYGVQDKTGKVKFNKESIDTLVSVYDEVTSPANTPVAETLNPYLRDLLEISYKIKYNEYKSIDQLAEAITLCANISEDPNDFKSAFDKIVSALGVTSDNKKHLYDMSSHNNKRLHNRDNEFGGKNINSTETGIPGDVERRVDVDSGVGYTDESGFGDGAAGEDFAMPESGVTSEMEFPENLPIKETPPEIVDFLDKKLRPEDIKLFEDKLTDFKNIQIKGELTNSQLSCFIELAKLKEKGWEVITYKDLKGKPSIKSIIDEANSDRFYIETGERIKDLRRSRSRKNPASEAAPEGIGNMSKNVGDEVTARANEVVAMINAEATKAGGEVAGAVPAIQEVGRTTMEQALNRLGVLGISPEEIVDMEKTLSALRGLKIDEVNPRDSYKILEVPEFLKPRAELNSNWWNWKKPTISNFINKLKEWLPKRKTATGLPPAIAAHYRANEEGMHGQKTGFMRVAILVISAVVGLYGKKEEAVKKPAVEISQPLTDKAVNLQKIDDIPNPYPPVFERQTIYPEVPHITAPDIGAPNIKPDVSEPPRVESKPMNPVLEEATRITPEMKAACARGDNSYMIKCIRATVGAQPEKVRSEITKIIFDAAQAKAKAEKVNWQTLNDKEKNAYVDAVLGGGTGSPSDKLAIELGLRKINMSFPGLNGKYKTGMAVEMPKYDHVPADIVIKYVRELK